MKKISILFATLVAVLCFSSCKEDTTPRLDKDPATLAFTINTPPMANQVFELTTDGTFDLSCSQPDYGFSAICNYVVQVSLSPEFKHNAKFAHEGEENYVPQAGDYVELRDPSTVANMQVKDLYLTRAICKLLPWTNADGEVCSISQPEDLTTAMAQCETAHDGYLPVYIRIRCMIPQAEEASSVTSSNYVTFNYVKPFFSLEEPGYIWLIGLPTAWDQNETTVENAAQVKGYTAKVSELSSEIDSKVYHWKGYIEAGNFQFRFYTVLGDWESNSIGAQVDDSPVDIEMDGGKYAGSYVVGKGSWQIPGWEGGLVEITVDMNEETVEFREVSE